MNKEQLQAEVKRRKRSGDLNRCAAIYGHSYEYLVQVSTGVRNNQAMLEDLLNVIKERERMEAKLHLAADNRKEEQRGVVA
jgi:6-pyruvoyl-tetrahydropterin synthase